MNQVMAMGSNHCDVFENRFSEIAFTPVSFEAIKEMDEWTATVLSDFMSVSSRFGVLFQVGDLQVIEHAGHPAPPSQVFKIIGHPLVSFVDVMPATRQFLYVRDSEHRESMSYDEVLAASYGAEFRELNGKPVIAYGDVIMVDERTVEDKAEDAKGVLRSWGIHEVK